MRKIAINVSCAVALAVSAGASAETTHWNIATSFPDSEFITQNVYQFADDVEQKTGGEVIIQVHSGQSLFRQPEMRRAVRTGQIEGGEVMMGNLINEDPIYAADNLPFVYSGYEDARKLWEAQRPIVAERLKSEGIMLLFAVPWPEQGFYTADTIESMADMEGVKFRTPNAMSSEMARLMGAEPTTVEAVEIPQAFSTGIVDAMVTSAATGIRTKAWDFSNHYYDVKAYMPKNMVFINERAFNRLNKDEQAALLEAAKEAEARGWAQSEEASKSTAAELAEKMPVHTPSEAFTKQAKEVGRQMADAWLEETGEDGKTILDALK